MTIIEYFAAAAVTGCVTSFVVVLLKKPGVFFRRGEDIGPSFAEWCQARAPKLIGELMSCEYCQNFWCSWLVSIPAAVLTGDILWLLVPFCSTSVGRLLSA